MATVLRVLVVALVDFYPSDADRRAPSQLPGFLDGSYAPDAFGTEVIKLGLTSNTAEFGIQRLSREVIDVLLVTVDESEKRIIPLSARR